MAVGENLVTIMPITSAMAMKEIKVNKCLKVKLDADIMFVSHIRFSLEPYSKSFIPNLASFR